MAGSKDPTGSRPVYIGLEFGGDFAIITTLIKPGEAFRVLFTEEIDMVNGANFDKAFAGFGGFFGVDEDGDLTVIDDDEDYDEGPDQHDPMVPGF